MDRVVFEGEFFAKVGVAEKERQKPRKIRVRVEAYCDLRNLKDRISNTTDYLEIESAVKKAAARPPVCLLETLAERMAHAVRKLGAKKVRVRIEKPGILGKHARAFVEVER